MKQLKISLCILMLGLSVSVYAPADTLAVLVDGPAGAYTDLFKKIEAELSETSFSGIMNEAVLVESLVDRPPGTAAEEAGQMIMETVPDIILAIGPASEKTLESLKTDIPGLVVTYSTGAGELNPWKPDREAGIRKIVLDLRLAGEQEWFASDFSTGAPVAVYDSRMAPWFENTGGI